MIPMRMPPWPKIVLLLALLFAVVISASWLSQAGTRNDFIFRGAVFLALIVVTYAPVRWWWKKG